MDTGTPRFSRLVIESLFGDDSLTVDIPFRLNERVTILHGRNGSGKTITLQLLHALREGWYEALLAYPFKRLELTLTDGSSLSVAPVEADTKGNSARARFAFTYLNPDGGQESWPTMDIPSSEELGDWLESSPQLPRRFKRISRQEWMDLETRRLLSPHQILRHHPWLAKEEYNWGPARAALFQEAHLYHWRERLPAVKLIGVERLHARSIEVDFRSYQADRPQRTTQLISEDIRDLVADADRKYRRISTQLDGSLASRLFSASDPLSLEELKQRYRTLNKQERGFVALGLLSEPSTTVDEKDMTEAQRNILHTILMDREKKLQPFDEVVNKAQRLIESLNRKLAPKSVKLNVETGYQVFTASGQPLPLEKLSSGEQHALVLQHELLFDVSEGSLILIDEPELSLHVTWQEEFVPDIMAIAELAHLDFLLATHSPYIVGDHEDLMVRQGALEA